MNPVPFKLKDLIKKAERVPTVHNVGNTPPMVDVFRTEKANRYMVRKRLKTQGAKNMICRKFKGLMVKGPMYPVEMEQVK